MERRDVPQRPPTTFAGSSAALAHLRRELRDQPAEALRASKVSNRTALSHCASVQLALPFAPLPAVALICSEKN